MIKKVYESNWIRSQLKQKKIFYNTIMKSIMTHGTEILVITETRLLYMCWNTRRDVVKYLN